MQRPADKSGTRIFRNVLCVFRVVEADVADCGRKSIVKLMNRLFVYSIASDQQHDIIKRCGLRDIKLHKTILRFINDGHIDLLTC